MEKNLDLKQFRRLIETLAGCGPEVSMWVGGSFISDYRNITSDLDLFFIGHVDEMELIERRLQGIRHVDAEYMPTERLTKLVKILRDAPQICSTTAPLLDYWDMRFITRILLGRSIRVADAHMAILKESRIALRNELIKYAALNFSTLYEDLYGLISNAEYFLSKVRIGELFLRACSLALAYQELSDPSYKWAYSSLRKSASKTTLKILKEFEVLISDANNSEQALKSALKLSRALVATVRLVDMSRVIPTTQEWPLNFVPLVLPEGYQALDVMSCNVMPITQAEFSCFQNC